MRTTHLALFGLLLFCLTYVHQKKFDAPTPVSRLDLLHALWLHHTVSIDNYHQNTPDKALFEDHYYSDKAPGTVALAFTPFALAALFLAGTGVDLDSELGWLFSSWFACAASIGLITALGGVALFSWMERHVSSRAALVTTLAVFLGAAPLPYSTMMFSHALVVGLLSIAIWAIGMQSDAQPLSPALSPSEGERENASAVTVSGQLSVASSQSQGSLCCLVGRNRWDLLAGFACGWALASEYSSGLIVVGLFCWLLSLGWRRVIPFCVAAIPPLLLIPAYSWACLGDPFTLPYTHQATFPAMQEGLYAIRWPDANTAFNLLFSPARGLLFWSPFLAISMVGYWKLLQTSPRLFWLTYAVPLLHTIVISGRVWDWSAGPAWGPRLLSPILPLLALPCAYGVARFPGIGLVLAIYSIELTTLATLTDACPSFSAHSNPLFDLNLPLSLKGEFSPNLGMAMGLPPVVSVALYYAVLIGGTGCLWRRLGKAGVQLEDSQESETKSMEPSSD